MMLKQYGWSIRVGVAHLALGVVGIGINTLALVLVLTVGRGRTLQWLSGAERLAVWLDRQTRM